jgi:hypothetical protein
LVRETAGGGEGSPHWIRLSQGAAAQAAGYGVDTRNGEGFGQEPLMLLTNVEVRATRRSVWAVVSGYLTRWLVEETIRFIEQSYRFEDIRVLDYQRLKNLTAFVLATVYFCASRLGERLKQSVLVTRVTGVAKRFFGVLEFHYYALADGIMVLLSRLGSWSAEGRLIACETSATQPWLFTSREKTGNVLLI